MLNKDDLRSINFTATRFFMKLFRTSNSLVIADCQTFSELNHATRSTQLFIMAFTVNSVYTNNDNILPQSAL